MLLVVVLLIEIARSLQTFAQTSGVTEWTVRLRGVVQPRQPERDSLVIPMKVKNRLFSFVWLQLLSEEELIPITDMTGITTQHGQVHAVAVSGEEKWLAELLWAKVGEVFELTGVYNSAARTFHLSGLQQLERYSLYPGCHPLPVLGPEQKVSVYVAKAEDTPGFVCARVVNKLDEVIYNGPFWGELEQWKEGNWWRKGQFHRYQPDLLVNVPSLMTRLKPGIPSDHYLPLSRLPAPPGQYRVCVHYETTSQAKHKVCSEEFMLP